MNDLDLYIITFLAIGATFGVLMMVIAIYGPRDKH